MYMKGFLIDVPSLFGTTSEKESKEHRQKVLETKRKILSRFSQKQLEDIKSRHLLIGPFGILNPTKHDLVEYLASNLSLDTIIDEAERYMIEYRDLIDELEKFEPREDLRLENVIKNKELANEINVSKILEILEDFKPDPVENERELKDQLYYFLNGALRKKGVKVRRENSIRNGRIDILIERENDRPIGIELKIARSRNKLDELIGQVRRYKKANPSVEIIAVILDIGYNIGLDEYIEMLEEEGVKVKILKGYLRRIQRKTRKKTIIIIK